MEDLRRKQSVYLLLPVGKVTDRMAVEVKQGITHHNNKQTRSKQPNSFSLCVCVIAGYNVCWWCTFIIYVSVSDQFVKYIPPIIYIKHTRAYFFIHTYVRAYLFICFIYIYACNVCICMFTDVEVVSELEKKAEEDDDNERYTFLFTSCCLRNDITQITTSINNTFLIITH